MPCFYYITSIGKIAKHSASGEILILVTKFFQSFINQDKRKTEDEDKSQSFMQKYEQKIRHFGESTP